MKGEKKLTAPTFAYLLAECEGMQSDYVTDNIQKCVQFWNSEGLHVYAENLNRVLGSEATNQMALEMTFDDFLLEMVLCDIGIFCRSGRNEALGYSCGRTRSHVWLHDSNNERVMMVYFSKNKRYRSIN